MKWFAWLRRSRLDDLSDEIQSHIEEKTDALIATGLSRADAEREARRAFGNPMVLNCGASAAALLIT